MSAHRKSAKSPHFPHGRQTNFRTPSVSVLLCDMTSVGRLSLAIKVRHRKRLPDPVTPNNV